MFFAVAWLRLRSSVSRGVMPGKIPSIVFINHWAKSLGGAEYSLLDILSSVSKRVRAYLVTSEPGALIVKAASLPVECRIVPCSLRPGKNIREHFFRVLAFSGKEVVSFIRFVFYLSQLIKKVKPEIIHANIPLSHLSLFILVLMGYRGKCIFHIREIFKRNSLPFMVYQLLFPRSRGHIIAISEAVKQNLPSAMKKKAIVLYNGISVPQLLPKREIKADSATKFLYLGRIVPWKGCHRLIDIFSKVKNRHSQGKWELSLIGDTSYWSATYRTLLQKQMRSSGLESDCFLLPHTDDPAGAMRVHDVFVNASFQEPLGRSIAEAQAEGLAVIAFDSGGIREIVEHGKTGILVPYGDEEGFVNAIERIIENKEEAIAMGLRGHERVKNYFNRDIQMPKICDELLKQIDSA
jgi:glycosyltransferase involved in cell wall biosynthesis